MQVKCDYCGSYISEKDEFCKHCGAVNSSFKRSVDGTPKTIAELKAWYASKNLPPEDVTRFFIGTNYKGPRAFGIYEENGNFIVYKNKDDGSRAIRYNGRDEAYAVNELYLKLKNEILNQKAHNINNVKVGTSNVGKNFKKLSNLMSFLFVLVCILMTVVFSLDSLYKSHKDKPYAGNYYCYEDEVYYCNSYVYDDWYWYDESSNDYLPVNIPSQMYDDIQNYKFSDTDEWDVNIEKFEDTETGQYVASQNESSSSSDSSDSSYSWDSSDSWDSGSSDWGSDW